MATNLFVGNLPYSMDSAKLEELFAQAGAVASAKVISDKYSGRSRGFGFVEMATDEEAQAAGFEEVAITGKKGTVLLIDTRGIHQGGTLLKGHRAVFNTYFYVGKE